MKVREIFPDYVVFYESDEEDWQLPDALTVRGDPFAVGASNAPYNLVTAVDDEFCWDEICDLRLWMIGDWHNQLAVSWVLSLRSTKPIRLLSIVDSERAIVGAVVEFPGLRSVDYSKQVELRSAFTDSIICARILALIEVGILRFFSEGLEPRLRGLGASPYGISEPPEIRIGLCVM
ncbi:MAG: hypothetical protein Aurels2KO_32480 [Aureliella sp.]